MCLRNLIVKQKVRIDELESHNSEIMNTLRKRDLKAESKEKHDTYSDLEDQSDVQRNLTAESKEKQET